MILHIQRHENHLLTVLAESVSARIFTENTDPLDIFLQTRPFSGSLPRRVGFWTTTDRQQQQVLRVDTQPTAQAPPQRHTERTTPGCRNSSGSGCEATENKGKRCRCSHLYANGHHVLC